MSVDALFWAMQGAQCPPLARLVLIYLADWYGASWVNIDGERGDQLIAKLSRSTGLTPAEVTEQLLMLMDSQALVLVRPGVLWVNNEPAPAKFPFDPPKHLPAYMKAAVYERDGTFCKLCGALDNLQIDHILPRARGGQHVLDNLQVLCQPCNGRKGARFP